MKTIEITIEDYLYEFYRRAGEPIGKEANEVIADALFKLAGELSVNAVEAARKRQENECDSNRSGFLFSD